MPWAKIDDQYTDHPKIVQVGPLGMALHIAAICYCARYLTDGFVPAAMIPRLLNLDGITTRVGDGNSNAVTNEEITEKLTAVGLFEIVPGGFQVHDYLEYNPSGEDVRAERKQNAVRQDVWRANKRNKGGSNAVTPPVTNGANNGHVTGAPSPSPLTPTKVGGGKPPPAKNTKPHSRKTREADERSKTPAVLCFKGITGKYPAIEIYDEVIAALGDRPDGEKLANCFKAWIKRGYNRERVDGWLFDWYKNGVPEDVRANGKGSQGSDDDKLKRQQEAVYGRGR